MYCQKCGAQLADDARFCVRCQEPIKGAGKNLSDPTDPVSYSSQPSFAENEQQRFSEPQKNTVVSDAPVIRIMKSIASSPAMLTVVIIKTIISVLLLAAVVGVSIAVGATVGQSVRDIILMICLVLILIVLIAPAILETIGMWSIFVSGSNRTGKKMTTVGFVMLRIVTIISMVGSVIAATWIVFLLTIPFSALLGFFGSGARPLIYTTPLMVGLYFASIYVIAIIAYQVASVRMFSSLERTVVHQRPCGTIPLYVAVMNFIIAGAPVCFAFFELIFLVVSSAINGVSMWPVIYELISSNIPIVVGSAIGVAMNTAVYICLGIAVLNYRRYSSELLDE